MSGKKSGQVVDLLESGLRARDLTNDMINRSLKGNLDNYMRDASKLEVLQKELSSFTMLSSEAKDMFGEKGTNQEADCKKLYDGIMSLKSDFRAINEIKDTLQKVDQDISSCDAEAARIRRAVANKYDYCDAEYKQASILKKKYEAIAASRRDLDSKSQMLSGEAANRLQDAISKRTSFLQLRKSIEDMNAVAQNRKVADTLKNQINSLFDEIPHAWAAKIYGDEHKKLEANWEELKNKDDAIIIDKAPTFLNELNIFISDLTNRIAKWEKEKKEAEFAWSQVNSICDSEFVDALDFNVNGDKAKKIKLFTYIDNYASTDFNKRLSAIKKQADTAMDDEEFIEAKKLYLDAEKVAIEARDYAVTMQENMIKKMELAKAIEDVMYEMDYDTETIIIDDNPNLGFRIVCTAGDEVIDFTNINYDKEGNPIVEIDHTEPANGNCHKSWEILARAMRRRGIPLTDVQKGGRSILTVKSKVASSMEKGENHTAMN